MVVPSSTDDFSISVIIPTYNRLSFLRKALISVSQQTHSILETIVVDDGSDDQTIDILGPEFPDVCFLTQGNQGVSSARNLGIHNAKGDWIALLDSDDQWLREKTEKQINYHIQNPKVLASHTGEKWIRKGNQVIPPAFLNKSREGLFERSLERCIICPSSVLLHRSIFQHIGCFDESLKICEDYDFWLRLLLEFQLGLIDEALVEKHGGHSDQLSNSTWGLDRFRLQSLEKIQQLPNTPFPHQIKILETLLRKCELLHTAFLKHEKLEEAEIYLQKKHRAAELLENLKNPSNP